MRFTHSSPLHQHVWHSAVRRGFTLIELLVVVAIIALLMAILMPSLAKAREQAKGTKCLAQLRSYGTAQLTYSQEYNLWAVPLLDAPYDNPYPKSYWAANLGFRASMGVTTTAQYGSNFWARQYLCPNAEYAMKGINAYYGTLYNANAFNRGLFDVTLSYGYNGLGMRFYYNHPTAKDWKNNLFLQGIKMTSVVSATDSMMFGDSLDMSLSASPTGGEIWIGTPTYINNDWADIRYYGGTGQQNQQTFPAYRHNQGMNAIMWDGHGEWLTYTRVLTSNALKTNLPTTTLRSNYNRIWRYSDDQVIAKP